MKETFLVDVISNQLDRLIFQLKMEYIYMQEIGLSDEVLFQCFIYVNNEYERIDAEPHPRKLRRK